MGEAGWQLLLPGKPLQVSEQGTRWQQAVFPLLPTMQTKHLWGSVIPCPPVQLYFLKVCCFVFFKLCGFSLKHALEFKRLHCSLLTFREMRHELPQSSAWLLSSLGKRGGIIWGQGNTLLHCCNKADCWEYYP